MLTENHEEAERARAGSRPVIAGTLDEVRATVEEYADAGVDELIVPGFNLGPPAEAKATLDRFLTAVAGRRAGAPVT